MNNKGAGGIGSRGGSQESRRAAKKNSNAGCTVKKNIRILGVDPALSITGYGIIDSVQDRMFLVNAGVIKTSSRQSLPERLREIYDTLQDLIRENKPEVMVLEKVFVHYHHPTTAFLLGQARGIICFACAKDNIPLVEYSATRVKKAIAGSGQASKSQIQRMVAGMLNLKNLPPYMDITDALALAITYSHVRKIDSACVMSRAQGLFNKKRRRLSQYRHCGRQAGITGV